MNNTFMKSLAHAFFVSFLATSSSARNFNPVVIELFTSQGCSSCPEASEVLGNLTENPDLLPLSLHVDYWDYIGWKDTFAQAQFTERQRQYALHVGERTLYTPQAIIEGVDRVVGSDAKAISKAIIKHRDAVHQVDIKAKRGGDYLEVSLHSSTPLDEAVNVQLVRYLPEETVKVTHGENAGRDLTYHNVVVRWDIVATWDGVETLNLRIPMAGDEPAVVIIQKSGPGEIIGSAHVH